MYTAAIKCFLLQERVEYACYVIALPVPMNCSHASPTKSTLQEHRPRLLHCWKLTRCNTQQYTYNSTVMHFGNSMVFMHIVSCYYCPSYAWNATPNNIMDTTMQANLFIKSIINKNLNVRKKKWYIVKPSSIEIYFLSMVLVFLTEVWCYLTN